MNGHFPSQLIAAELVLDIFHEAIDNGISDISENEILTFLGVPEKNIDRKNNKLYDLSGLTKETIQKASEEILLRGLAESKS